MDGSYRRADGYAGGVSAMTDLEARILTARNYQLVARLAQDRTMESAATKLLDVALEHWAKLREPAHAAR